MSQIAPFFEAIAKGDTDVIRTLAGEDTTLLAQIGPQGSTAISWAVYNGQGETAKLLIELGAPVNLFDSAITGSIDRLCSLLKDGAPIDDLTSDGFTALQGAAYFGQVESARVLLEAGADVETRSTNPMKLQAINAAAAHHNANASTEIGRLLLDAGADVNARMSGGFTPLHAAMQNQNAPMTELLIERGADSSAKTDEGKTPQDYANEQSAT